MDRTLVHGMHNIDAYAINFFYDNAGFSYDPKTETATAGRLRGAMSLATAERRTYAAGYTYGWSDDWEVGNHLKEYGEAYADGEPDTCETLTVYDADGDIVASLSCIDSATGEYRRVCQAEMALEALADADAAKAKADAALRETASCLREVAMTLAVYRDGRDLAHADRLADAVDAYLSMDADA